MRAPADSLPTRLATALALVLAGAVLSIWLWSHVCAFPAIVWNDMRLAPSIALAHGLPVYPTAHHGTINTWMYGPLPVIYYLPAAWASTAAGAVMTAGALNLALTLVPLALVCFGWPAWDRETDSPKGRTAAFLLCMALWPERHYEVIFADNLAIACGLVGSLLLIRARTAQSLWLAAFVATAAVACKQITIGIPLAHVLWLALTAGRRAAFVHALRCGAAGLAIGGAMVAVFGGAGLWFMWWLPAQLPWNLDLARLRPALPEAALQVALPAVAIWIGRRAFSRSILLLPALLWACALPTGLLALAKIGGWLNSFHSLVLWLPPVVTVLFTVHWSERANRWTHLSAAVAAAVIACGRVLETPRLSLRPRTAHYGQAERLAMQYREQIWFPFHPVVTLYSDGRYYHDEDGFYVRQTARRPPTPAQVAAHVPPAMRVMAFHVDWNDWGIAKKMLPPGARATSVDDWALWTSHPGSPSR